MLSIGSLPKQDAKFLINPDATTPCAQCPKHALYPDNRGLHPNNSMAVALYYKARRPVRVATMGGAFLTWTIDPSNLSDVLDEHHNEFAHWLHRRETFDKVLVIDQVATEIQSEREERERKAAENKSKNQ